MVLLFRLVGDTRDLMVGEIDSMGVADEAGMQIPLLLSVLPTLDILNR